jgi:hypothetical protein
MVRSAFASAGMLLTLGGLRKCMQRDNQNKAKGSQSEWDTRISCHRFCREPTKSSNPKQFTKN